MGYDYYGLGDNDCRFYDMWVFWEISYENIDERNGYEIGVVYINNNDDYEGNGNLDGFNYYIIRNCCGEDGDSEFDNGSGLVIRYCIYKEFEYE